MQRLGHIGAAVVDDDLLRLFRDRHSQTVVKAHLLQIGPQKALIYIQVEEAGLDHFHLGKHIRACAFIFRRKSFCHIIRDHKGRLMITLCTCHGTVALIFAEVGAV